MVKETLEKISRYLEKRISDVRQLTIVFSKNMF